MNMRVNAFGHVKINDSFYGGNIKASGCRIEETGSHVIGHVTGHVTSPATSVATRMGNSFFLNVVMTLSLSP